MTFAQLSQWISQFMSITSLVARIYTVVCMGNVDLIREKQPHIEKRYM
jgi:hypothetical protein